MNGRRNQRIVKRGEENDHKLPQLIRIKFETTIEKIQEQGIFTTFHHLSRDKMTSSNQSGNVIYLLGLKFSVKSSIITILDLCQTIISIRSRVCLRLFFRLLLLNRRQCHI